MPGTDVQEVNLPPIVDDETWLEANERLTRTRKRRATSRRPAILLGTLPDASMIAASAGWALGAFLLGWFTFTYKANEFAYRL